MAKENTQVVRLRISDSLLKKLNKRALNEERTMASLIRQAIKKLLA